MSNSFRRAASIAVLLFAPLGLAACGESSSEKATKQVCAATSEISSQIKKLESLPISTSFPTEVSKSVEAIGKSLTEVKDAAPNLETARKEEVDAATKTFALELAALTASVVSASKSSSLEAGLKSAEPQIKASLSKLGTDYKKAFEALKCS
jgi:hypothetical protein